MKKERRPEKREGSTKLERVGWSERE